METKFYTSKPINNQNNTIWDSLISESNWNTLEIIGYKRITSKEEATSSCDFRYNNSEITISKPNMIKIQSEDDVSLRNTESNLRKICNSKGLILVSMVS